MVGHVETSLALAAVDDHADSDWFGAVRAALGECLDYVPPRVMTFDYKHLFARCKFEISA